MDKHKKVTWAVLWILLIIGIGLLPEKTFLGILFILADLFFMRYFYKRSNKKKKIDEAQAYLSEVRRLGKIPSINSGLMLSSGEEAFLQENTVLRETRAVRHSTGGFGGVRIAKGITVGGYRGSSESHQEWRTIDSGQLILTNKKLIFDGKDGNRNMPIEKIIGCDAFSSSIQISLDGKSKDMAFPVKNSYIWASMIQVIKSVKDASDLKGVNLNVELK
jgi:hypothetical protein